MFAIRNAGTLLGVVVGAVMICGVAQAQVDQTWLECDVTHAIVHSDGTAGNSFSMKMIYVYDTGNLWTYYPSNQKLNAVSGAQIDSETISWMPASNGQSVAERTTINLRTGEYRASSVIQSGDGQTITQTDSGQCQTIAARSVVDN